MDLSPRAAASTVFDVRSPAATAKPASSRRSAPTSSDPAAELSAYLAAAGRHRGLSQADDPILVRTKEGYVFEGNGFDAVIRHDGTLEIDDHYAEAELMLRPQIHPDGSATLWLFGVTFDLTAWAEHLAGNDPYRSERRWFLERTKGLRERLALAAFRASLLRAKTRLVRDLRAIWGDPTLPMWQRKQRTFAHWDRCADDEVGQLGRRMVERFVRARCPPDSECAFRDADQRTLNAGRRSRAVFAPYEGALLDPVEDIDAVIESLSSLVD